MDGFLYLHSCLAYWTSFVDWDALGAIATLAAVLVALWPIYQGWNREAAHARSLRIRIGAHLFTLLPTLEEWRGLGPQGVTLTTISAMSRELLKVNKGFDIAPLSPGQFKQIVSELMVLMNESGILDTEEQEQLVGILTNLSEFARIDEDVLSGHYLLAEPANYTCKMITDLLERFQRRGVYSGGLIFPLKLD